jgi:FkbM family methyltransferase
MSLATTTLPDGRSIYCVNTYEVEFSVAEIFNDDLQQNGLDLPEDGVYFDVGANIGLYALFIQSKCPQARIYSYEPIPSSHTALEKNLAALKIEAHAYHLALGTEPGEISFDYYPKITALSTSHSEVGDRLAGGLKQVLNQEHNNREVTDILEKTGAADRSAEAGFVDSLFEKETVTAKVDTLSNQIEKHNIQSVDLLKIDTEGAEKDVLGGLKASDWPKIRQLMVEVHIGKDECDRIEQDLQQRGYSTGVGDHLLAQGGVPVYQIFARREIQASSVPV